jgi:hypothetical protein
VNFHYIRFRLESGNLQGVSGDMITV